MSMDKNELLYLTGTVLLSMAMFEVTLFPFIINTFFPTLYIPSGSHKIIVANLYLFACLCYIFSNGYYKKQMYALAILFGFYLGFRLALFFV